MAEAISEGHLLIPSQLIDTEHVGYADVAAFATQQLVYPFEGE